VLRIAAALLALLGLLPVANLLTGGREVPWWTLGVVVWCGYGGLFLAVLWAVAARWEAPLDRLLDSARALLLRPRDAWFSLGAAAGTTLLAAGVALYCFAGRGSTGDEMAMAWHARMLLAGRLAIPTVAHPEFFNATAVMDQGPRWYSQYPVGGPALLALGFLLHAVWLVNPLLLGVAAWQLHRFARRAFDEETARAATFLFALTPFVLVLGATQLNHAPALALTLVALAELAAWDRDDAGSAIARHAAAIGLAVGAIALVRPLDAALVAVPIGLHQLARLRGSPARYRSLAVQCAAGAVPVALLLWANARTTGNPLLFAYDAANGPAHRIGFHLDPNGEMHTVRRGLVYLSGYLLRFDRFLFEWPLPGLLVVCGVLASLRRGTRWDTLLLGLVLAFLLGYGAYWYPGFFDGPRFLLPIAPVLVLYAARTGEAAAFVAHPVRRRVARILVPACVLCAWLVPLPFSSVPGRLVSLHEQRTKLKTPVGTQARAAGLTNVLVLVREPWRGRLLARLRAMGVQQFAAERIVSSVDACALQLALDAEDAATAGPATRRQRVLTRAAAAGPAMLRPSEAGEASVARAAGGPDTPRCREEAAADAFGTMPYAMFLREHQVDRAGRLTGPVVYARDFGPRDSLLRTEFGDRRWYLYRPGRSLDDAAAFVPLGVR
jgi:4-amino-4-deoxy-L-arabinose transferase-like glycosyltransferase